MQCACQGTVALQAAATVTECCLLAYWKSDSLIWWTREHLSGWQWAAALAERPGLEASAALLLAAVTMINRQRTHDAVKTL